jgi:hypothetical protein
MSSSSQSVGVGSLVGVRVGVGVPTVGAPVDGSGVSVSSPSPGGQPLAINEAITKAHAGQRFIAVDFPPQT